MSTPLEDYALIGDCETAALVSRGGSIDWLCWPRFDSPACFAALLGTSDHGRWLIAPMDERARVTRQYRDHTLILETRFETGGGSATLVDFMPPRGAHSDIVRLVRGERGRLRMRMELVLRFDYGRAVPWVTRLPDGTLRAIAGPDMVLLHTPVEVTGKDLTTVAEFDVAEGETVPFVLTHGPSHQPPPEAIKDLDASLLLVPTTGFLPADDARVRGTITAVERRLFVDGFLHRYDTTTAADGLPAGEGAFLACSFWLADAYTLIGRLDDARRLFERLLALRNDVGLLAEEYDTRLTRQVGNFPQAFSHVALVNTAHNLSRATRPAEQRASHVRAHHDTARPEAGES